MAISVLKRLVNIRVFRKSPVSAYLRLNEMLWNQAPIFFTKFRPIQSYGMFLHKLVRLRTDRRQFFGTFFFRNRPELELICRLLDHKEKGSTLTFSVVGCSNGAEVYSILWKIRSARPDLKVVMHSMDISKEVLSLAQKGIYSLNNPELVDAPIFSRITEKEMLEMFDQDGDYMKIKSWIKKGIIWHPEDAGDPKILSVLGPQDMVVANNFLCHMCPPDSERCLRNIAQLLKPGGYLFVSGIDLDIRKKVASDLGWKPVRELMEEIHDGDPVLRDDWPFKWWGLEPLNKKRPGWKMRFASVFQIAEKL